MGLFGRSSAPKPADSKPTDDQAGAPGEQAKLAYQEVSTVELDDRARQLVATGQLKVRLVDDTRVASLRVDGPCARCGHVYSQTRALELPVSAIRRAERIATPAYRWAYFLCDCLESHPDGPPGVTGCGASYSVEPPPSPGGPTVTKA